MAVKTYEAILSVLDKASEPILKIQEHLRAMGEAGAKANKLMAPHQKLFHETSKQLSEFTEKFGKIGEQASEFGARLGEMLGPLGAIGAVGSVAGIVEMTHAFAENVEVMRIAAQSAGTTINAWQGLAYAAKQAGVPADSLQHSLGMLSRNLGNAAVGKNKDLVSLMHYLHIATRGANGQLLSSAAILPNIADALAKLHNSTQRAAYGNQIFGRSYEQILPFLSLGGAKIKELMALSEKYDYQISPEDNEAAEQFTQSWNNMQASVGGLTNEIGAKLSPVMQPIIQQVADWTAKNRDWISTDMAKALQSVSDSLKQIDLKIVIADMEKFGANTLAAIEAVGGFKTIMIATGLIMTAQFVWPLVEMTGAVVGLTYSLGKPLIMATGGAIVAFAKMIPMMRSLRDVMAALDLVIEANPFGALMLGVAAVVEAGYELYQNWDTVTAFFKQAWENVGSFLSDAWADVVTNFQPTIAFFEAMGRLIEAIFKVAGNKISEDLKSAGHEIEAVWNEVSGCFVTVGHDIENALKKDGVFKDLEDAATTIENAWKPVAAFFKSIGDDVEKIGGGFQNVQQYLPDGSDVVVPERVASSSNPLGAIFSYLGSGWNQDAAPSGQRSAIALPGANTLSQPLPAPARAPILPPVFSLSQPVDHQDAPQPVDLTVTINHVGAPVGTKTAVQSSGANVKVVETNKGYSRMAHGS